MTAPTGAFEIECLDGTLVVTPVTELRELDYPEIESGAQEVLRLLASGTAKNLVLDFHQTDYYGSTALAFFVKLWKRVREHKGRMAMCCLSTHEREILKVTGLDGLWPICATRAEAIETVRA